MGDYIGALVKRFESGTKGSLSLSSCGNDWGLSCGSYQLTLRWGNCIKFLQKYFPEQAKTLYFRSNKPDIKTNKWPGKDYCSSPEQVKAVWKACYNAVGAEKFFSYEHEHIQNGYYEQLMKKLGGYFNPNNHSRAMQECMWSWAVHRGVRVPKKRIKKKDCGRNTIAILFCISVYRQNDLYINSIDTKEYGNIYLCSLK